MRRLGNVRKLVCRPYLILCRIAESRRTVEILRFWHGTRGGSSVGSFAQNRLIQPGHDQLLRETTFLSRMTGEFLNNLNVLLQAIR